MTPSLRNALTAELIGTGLLLATIIGSGIMGEHLAGGNIAIALLGNTIATGAMLFVLITIFGPLSGAHFNPVVSLAMCLTGRMQWRRFVPYVLCQGLGAMLGVWLAHAMFDLAIFEISLKQRWGIGQWVAEAVATFGLLLTIFGGLRFNAAGIAMLVGLYITAAYWFTASTSFANPAVTLARAFSNTFAGIAPASMLPFIGAQLVGMGLAVLFAIQLFDAEQK